MRKINKQDITCVFEGVAGIGAIFISNIIAAQNGSLLNKLGIKAIVTVVKGGDVKHDKQEVTDHLRIPAYDIPTEDISQYFEQTYNFIDMVRKKTNVLVHCHAGISRSSTIVIAYLLKKYSYSLDNVIAMVKRRRSKINPNQGFLQQLKQEAIKMGIPCTPKIDQCIQILLKQRNIKGQLTPQKKRAFSSYNRSKILFSPRKNTKKEQNNQRIEDNQQIKCEESSPKQSLIIKESGSDNLKEKIVKQETQNLKVKCLTPQPSVLKTCKFQQIQQLNNFNFLHKQSPKQTEDTLANQTYNVNSTTLKQQKFSNTKIASKIQKIKSQSMKRKDQKKRSSSIFMYSKNNDESERQFENKQKRPGFEISIFSNKFSMDKIEQRMKKAEEKKKKLEEEEKGGKSQRIRFNVECGSQQIKSQK